VEVPNCLISKETLVKEDPESESISGHERSIASSPVIKVYGSAGVEANSEEALKVGTTELSLESEATKAGDRINPYGAWATGRKSEANGVLEKEAPVFKTIGNVVGTESEAVVVGAEATTVGTAVTESTVEATDVANEEVRLSPTRVSN